MKETSFRNTFVFDFSNEIETSFKWNTFVFVFSNEAETSFKSNSFIFVFNNETQTSFQWKQKQVSSETLLSLFLVMK